MGSFWKTVRSIAINVAILSILLDGMSLNLSGVGDADAPDDDRQSLLTRPKSGMEYCLSCRHDFVWPVAWDEIDSSGWQVELRCGNCHASTIGVFSYDQVERFDRVLDDQMLQVVADLRHLAWENMHSDVERLVAALHSGHILPEDF